MRWLAVVVCCAWCVPLSAHGAPDCSQAVFDIPIEKEEATASFFANFRNRPGSVSFESERIFNKAKTQVFDLKAPTKECPVGCKLRDIPYMYFESTPQKFLSKYSDAEHCRALQAQTTGLPITYTNNTLTSVETLIAWIGELTQGKGKEGKDLYKRCDKSCSPRYDYHITKLKRTDETYNVTVSIVCGDARDKDHDMYDLSAFFRYICEPI